MLEKYPSKILSTPSTDVGLREGKEIGLLLEKAIKEECTYMGCAGLAAPQIGINKKVFIALGILYINPEITYYGNRWDTLKEGCFSLDDKRYPVRRAYNIRMRWHNKKGEPKEGSFSGWNAEVLQHEYDHLLGKLCCG